MSDLARAKVWVGESTTSGPHYALREKPATSSEKARNLALKAMGGACQNYSGTNARVGGRS